MRITVCETPHDPLAAEGLWGALRSHVRDERTELLILPEFAFLEPVWEGRDFDPERWAALEAASDAWLARLPELQYAYVVGAAPATLGGRPFNQGFLWSAASGLVP